MKFALDKVENYFNVKEIEIILRIISKPQSWDLQNVNFKKSIKSGEAWTKVGSSMRKGYKKEKLTGCQLTRTQAGSNDGL